MREQHSISADLIFKWQGLRLELDPVIAGDIGPHVKLRGRLKIQVTTLKYDFRVAQRKAVVPDTPA